MEDQPGSEKTTNPEGEGQTGDGAQVGDDPQADSNTQDDADIEALADADDGDEPPRRLTVAEEKRVKRTAIVAFAATSGLASAAGADVLPWEELDGPTQQLIMEEVRELIRNPDRELGEGDVPSHIVAQIVRSMDFLSYMP